MTVWPFIGHKTVIEAWPGPLMIHLNAFVIEIFTAGSSPGDLPLSSHTSGILKNRGRFARIPPDPKTFYRPCCESRQQTINDLLLV